MQLNTNFSVGLYSGLAAFVSAVILLLYVKFIKKKNIAFIICSLLIVSSAFLLVFYSNIITFSIYYFINKICCQILINGVNENVFIATKGTSFENYKKEHHLVFSLFNYVFQLIGFALAFLIYNCLNNIYSISVIVLILNSLIFLSNYFLIKSNRFKENLNINVI